LDLALTDKVVIVTGATANIGRAIALDFATAADSFTFTGRSGVQPTKTQSAAAAAGRDNRFHHGMMRYSSDMCSAQREIIHARQ
jgi:NAD(P)-dependent dehydrogenase (short-subunit alcohol dehydrogenase family)